MLDQQLATELFFLLPFPESLGTSLPLVSEDNGAASSPSFSAKLAGDFTPHCLEIFQNLQFMAAEVTFHFSCPQRRTQAVFPPSKH